MYGERKAKYVSLPYKLEVIEMQNKSHQDSTPKNELHSQIYPFRFIMMFACLLHSFRMFRSFENPESVLLPALLEGAIAIGFLTSFFYSRHSLKAAASIPLIVLCLILAIEAIYAPEGLLTGILYKGTLLVVGIWGLLFKQSKIAQWDSSESQ